MVPTEQTCIIGYNLPAKRTLSRYAKLGLIFVTFSIVYRRHSYGRPTPRAKISIDKLLSTMPQSTGAEWIAVHCVPVYCDGRVRVR